MKTTYDYAVQFRRDLIARGLDKKDVETAIELFKAIVGLDHLCFPSRECAVHLCTVKHEYAKAGYTPARPGRIEHYTIIVPGLSRFFYKPPYRLKFREKAGGIRVIPETKRRRIRFDEAVMVIAAHEVRHRIQFNKPKGLICFSARIRRHIKGNLTKRIANQLWRKMVLHRESLRKAGRNETQIRLMTNDREFDSMVIQYLLAHKMRHLHKKEDVVDILFADIYSNM